MSIAVDKPLKTILVTNQ